MRRTVALAASLLAAASLGGCFYRTATRTGGVTGVSVDSSGRPVLVVAVCDGQLENVFLDRNGATGDIGEWQTVAVPGRQVVAVPVLSAPGARWTVAAAPTSVRKGLEYTAFGQSSDTKWTMTPVEFSTADLGRLTPSTVLSSLGTDARPNFLDAACATLAANAARQFPGTAASDNRDPWRLLRDFPEAADTLLLAAPDGRLAVPPAGEQPGAHGAEILARHVVDTLVATTGLSVVGITGSSGKTSTKDLLAQYSPGLDSYLDRWWEDQNCLWRKDFSEHGSAPRHIPRAAGRRRR